MARYKLVNGERIQFTAAEETARDAEEAVWEAGAFERAIKHLRMTRDNLLKETDYLALSDNTMSDEIKIYRKSLRDITEGLTTVEEVETVEFPGKPKE